MYQKRVNIQTIHKLIKAYGKTDKKKLILVLKKIFENPANIDTFAYFFFPETVTNKIPKFHMELYKELFKKGNNAFAAPRGHGKSSLTGIIFLIFSIFNNLEKYIVYISQNHSKTVQFLDPIRTEFKNNIWLKFVYGNNKLGLTKDETGRDREDCFDVLKVRVEAVSFEKNLRGFKYGNVRPTLIICDDIEDDMRVLNPELRVKDGNKLNKIIIPALDPDGRFKMIGTILHFDSLLVKKIKLHGGKVYSACDNDFKKLLWPERFTPAKLKQIKHDIGSIAFQQELQNNPIDNTASLIKREWIEECFDKTLSYRDAQKLEYENKFQGTDFAFSDRVTADNSAFASVGVKEGKVVVFDCQVKKGLSVNEQLIFLKEDLHAKYNYDSLGLEENSIKSISKDIDQWGMPITLFWTGASDPAAKRVPGKDYDYLGKRHTVGKISLIMRLGTAFENHRFRLPYKTAEDRKVTDRILSECTSYALAEGKLVEAGIHPDIPIALGYALELVNNYQAVIIDF